MPLTALLDIARHGTDSNACTAESYPRIFDRADGKQFDYVFNCGGESSFSAPDEVFRLRGHALSVGLAKESAKRGVKAFVELSSGMVYKSERVPRKETDKLKPWNRMGKWQLANEEALAQIPGLNVVILRLAHVYGDYDTKSYFARGFVLSRVYKEKNKDLMWLWGPELRINTINVRDTASAMWTAAEWRTKNNSIPQEYLPSGTKLAVPIFNLVDKGNTKQEIIVPRVKEIIGINVGFINTLISQFAKFNLESVVDDLNEETLGPWADLCAKGPALAGGVNPLTPYFETELLKDHDLSLDGTLFEKCTGFKHEFPIMTIETQKAAIESWKRMGWWP